MGWQYLTSPQMEAARNLANTSRSIQAQFDNQLVKLLDEQQLPHGVVINRTGLKFTVTANGISIVGEIVEGRRDGRHGARVCFRRQVAATEKAGAYGAVVLSLFIAGDAYFIEDPSIDTWYVVNPGNGDYRDLFLLSFWPHLLHEMQRGL